jgi:hypothetical protein
MISVVPFCGAPSNSPSPERFCGAFVRTSTVENLGSLSTATLISAVLDLRPFGTAATEFFRLDSRVTGVGWKRVNGVAEITAQPPQPSVFRQHMLQQRIVVNHIKRTGVLP